jgi:DUF1680 family protein
MNSSPYTFLHPRQICRVGGFLGARFDANRDGRLKDPMLSEEYIRRHEKKADMDWFWAGEQIGKWFDAAAYTALISNDRWLLERIEALLARLAKTQEEDGAVSITARRNRVPARGMELYEYYYVLHGLLVLYDLLGSQEALNIATRLGEYIIDTWGTKPGQFPLAGRFPGNGHGGGEGTLILEPIVLLGMATGQQRFIDWGEQTLGAWDAWLERYPESRFTTGYTAMKQFAARERDVYDLRQGIHAHTFHMTLLGLAALYNATGKQEYRETVLGSVDHLAEAWIFLTGGMSTGEGYLARRYYHPRGEIEVCPQHTWILMLAQAYAWTGQPRYLAEIERDLFNHFLAAQLADGSNWSYMTPLVGQAQEPEKPNCCNGAGQRIAGRMPTYLYGTHRQNPAVLMFSESEARFDLPGKPVFTITQETNFPSTGTITLRVQPEQPAVFPISVRIPPYAAGGTARINNGPAQPVPTGDFWVVEQEWRPGDTLHLDLPFPLTAQAGAEETAIVRGPLVYCLFQNAQPDSGIHLGRKGMYPEDAILHLDPHTPAESITEAPAPEGLLGPALRVAGWSKPKPPMFAEEGANSEIVSERAAEFLLLPFVNQGALRGDFSVFPRWRSNSGS